MFGCMYVKFFVGLLGLFLFGRQIVSAEAVRPGILQYELYQEQLNGKKVALVANQTSVVCEMERIGKNVPAAGSEEGVHTVDFLRQKGVEVVKIFCPEHGFRGTADAGERVGDYTDQQTGLPVVSLYGSKKKPLPSDLEGIEVVVFDMQDVGVRFYTYLSTLHYVMEACAENRLPLIVMDRPNPNAFYIDGPVLKSGYTSFVGMHPVPVVYGMTIGEYAKMINGEHWLREGVVCELTVIPCRNWSRDMIVELPRRPSPNLPDRISVMLYPSVCFFEGTVVNEGRGTRVPFQVFGHPELENMSYVYIPVAIEGMSKNPKCLGKTCYGRDLRDQYEVVKEEKRLRLDWLLEAYRNYKGKTSFFIPFFDKLAGTSDLREAILAGKTEAEIRESWQTDLEHFKKMRLRYLIY